MAELFVQAALIVFIYFLVFFLVAQAIKNNSFVDMGWGAGFVLLALIILISQGAYVERNLLMTLPFQGRSDLNTYTLNIINRLKPKALYLHHFDDSFPPVSDTMNTGSFIHAAAAAYPGLPVIVPEYKEVIVV